MTRLLLVAGGGAVGSALRHLLAAWMERRWGVRPWIGLPPTLWVNLLGCFVMQLVLALAAASVLESQALQLALTTGVLGGFTTYSAFNAELLAWADAGAYGRAVLYAAATVVGCLAVGLAGLRAGRALAAWAAA